MSPHFLPWRPRRRGRRHTWWPIASARRSILYAAFALFYLGVPLAWRRRRPEMHPRWGGGALLIASLALLLFLAAGPHAAASLWGLALLLAIVNAGLFIESASGAMPLLSVVGARALVDRAGRVVGQRRGRRRRAAVAARARRPHARSCSAATPGRTRTARAPARRSRSRAFSFRHGVYLALVGQFFLFFVARNPQWAAPPWPLFGALAVMTLATTAAALNVVMPELHAGGVIAAALVVFSFSQASPGAWALTSLAAAEAVGGVRRRIVDPVDARAAALALCRLGGGGRGAVRRRGQHHQRGARRRNLAARAVDRWRT